MPNKEEFNGFDDDIFSPEDFEIEEETPTEEPDEDESETDDKVEQVETQEETSETTEEPDEQVKTQEEPEVDEKAKAEAERNAYYAKKRREREAAEKAQREKEIRETAKLEAQLEMIKVNPYTNEAISDEEDLKIYKLQKAIEEKGGDPLSDLPKALAEQNRKEAQERKALAEQEQEKQLRLSKQASDLFAKYPEARETAPKDQELLDLIEKKDKSDSNWTMTDCYEYLVMKRKYESLLKTQQEAQTKKDSAVKEATNKYHKIPSSQPSGKPVSEDDYENMTIEQYIKKQNENKVDFF
jgi:hypothetical protein